MHATSTCKKQEIQITVDSYWLFSGAYQEIQRRVSSLQIKQTWAEEVSFKPSNFQRHFCRGIFIFGFNDTCSKIWSYFLHYHSNCFFQRQKWNTNDSHLDIKKVHLLVLAMITSTPKRKNSGIQKIMYKGMAGNMDYEDQSLLIERARTQSWPGVTQAVFANFGRGLVATREFVKNEVVIDYHGQIFTKKTMEEVSATEGVKREYCLEVKGPGRRIINATAEVCPFTQRTDAWVDWPTTLLLKLT